MGLLTKEGSADDGKYSSHQAATIALKILGEDVLGRIIQFAVVQQTPITFGYDSSPPRDALPAAAAFGQRIRERSQRIYLEENVFKFTHAPTFYLWAKANRHHATLLRYVRVELNPSTWQLTSLAQALKLCNGIKKLYLKFDEQGMVREQCNKSRGFQEGCSQDIDYQMNLQLLTIRCMDELRQLRFPHVFFLLSSEQGRGAIPGGVLQTLVAKEMMMPLPRAQPGSSRKRKLEKTQADDDDYLPPGEQASAKRKRAQKGPAIRHLAKRLQSTESSCRLLELPAELRNRIFSLVLQVDGNINPSTRGAITHIKPRKSTHRYSNPEAYSVLALLQTCKQIHVEAVDFYYSRNTFVFYYPIQLFTFMQSISDERKNCIRRVSLWTENSRQGGTNFTEATFMTLATLRGMRELLVNLDDKVIYQNRRGVLPGYDFLKSLAEKDVRITLRSSKVNKAMTCPMFHVCNLYGLDRKAAALIKRWQDGLEKS